MTSKPKEVYKSIKRSLSASTYASGFGGTGGARYHGYSGSKQWIHPPDVLNHGRVEYSVKMLGQTEVAAAKGTEVIRDAIQKIRFGLQVNRSVTGNSGAKLQKVDIQINGRRRHSGRHEDQDGVDEVPSAPHLLLRRRQT